MKARLTIATQPLMPGIVHRDHRPEILGNLRGHIIDRDAGGTGAEDLGMPAGMMHVVKLGQRPMAPADLISGRDRFRLKLDRRLPAQGRKSAVTDGIIERPEVLGA